MDNAEAKIDLMREELRKHAEEDSARFKESLDRLVDVRRDFNGKLDDLSECVSDINNSTLILSTNYAWIKWFVMVIAVAVVGAVIKLIFFS